MSIRKVKTVQPHGFIVWKNTDWDEYIVTPPNTSKPKEDETAPNWYHTDDKEDALDTAKAMAEEHGGARRENPRVHPDEIDHWLRMMKPKFAITRESLKGMADMSRKLHDEPEHAGEWYSGYLRDFPYGQDKRVADFGKFLMAWGDDPPVDRWGFPGGAYGPEGHPNYPRRKNHHLVKGEDAKLSNEYIAWLKKYGSDHYSSTELETRIQSAPHDVFEVLEVHPHGYTVHYEHPAPGQSHREFYPDEALVSASSSTRNWPGDNYQGQTPSDFLLQGAKQNPKVKVRAHTRDRPGSVKVRAHTRKSESSFPLTRAQRGSSSRDPKLTEEEAELLYRLGAAIENSGDPDATLVVYEGDEEAPHVRPLVDAGLALVVEVYEADNAVELRISDRGAKLYLDS